MGTVERLWRQLNCAKYGDACNKTAEEVDSLCMAMEGPTNPTNSHECRSFGWVGSLGGSGFVIGVGFNRCRGHELVGLSI